MLRSAASKVMWVGRATVFMVGLAVILALVFGVATTALGANLDNFILGKANNSATKVTGLVSNVANAAKSALLVKNLGPGPALDLKVTDPDTTNPVLKDVAPMKVDSQAEVANLNAQFAGQADNAAHADQATNAENAANADTVDGKHAADFYQAGSTVADSDKLDNKDSSDFASAALFGSARNSQISASVGPECTVGEVRLFASMAPKNWLPADGREMLISENQTLFTVLGTTYGGNGRSTFALPDLRGAEPKGAGPAAPFYAICIIGVFP